MSAPLQALVVQQRHEARDVLSLELRPARAADRFPAAAPGAHIDLHLAPGLVRSYSLVQAGTADRYTVAVLKDRASRGGSRHVHERLRVGQVIPIGAPRNHFPLHEDAPASVLVAGGIGITPVYAMLQRLAQLGRRAHLVYGARSRADAAYVAEIEALVGAHPALSAHFHWDDVQQAAPDLERLLSGHAPTTHAYCCGPGPMLDAFAAACQRLGLVHAHMERFAAAPQVDAGSTAGYTVELRRSGRTLAVPAGANLLDALLQAGCDISFSCREGLCGACETRVLSGDIEHRDSLLTPAERAANKSLMPCVSACRSATLALDA